HAEKFGVEAADRADRARRPAIGFARGRRVRMKEEALGPAFLRHFADGVASVAQQRPILREVRRAGKPARRADNRDWLARPQKQRTVEGRDGPSPFLSASVSPIHTAR